MTGNPTPKTWFVDGHAHLYPWFSRDRAFNLAQANFERICRTAPIPIDTPKVLALADPADFDSGSDLMALTQENGVSEWRVRPSRDGTGFVAARKRDGATLFLVLGSQVRTAEGLEVLSLASLEVFQDGKPLEECVAEVRRRTGFAVLPWGVGKWTFSRGHRVEILLKQEGGPGLLVGDNSGRLDRIRRPRLLHLAEDLGIPVLPGSDPLPLAGQERKLGQYGFLLQGGFDPDAPGDSLRNALKNLRSQPRSIGHRDGLVPFLLSQVRMQVRRLETRAGRDP